MRRWQAECWWRGELASESGQAVLLLVGAMAAVVVGAVLLGGIARGIGKGGREQRAADLGALAGARWMHDAYTRLFEPPRFGGRPNPRHLEVGAYKEMGRDAGAGGGACQRDPLRRRRLPRRRHLRPHAHPRDRARSGDRRHRRRHHEAPIKAVAAELAPPAQVPTQLGDAGQYNGPFAQRQGKPMRYLFSTRSSCKTASDPWSRAPISRGPCLNRDGAEHQAQRSRRERERVGARPPGAGTHACRHRQAFRGRPPAAAAVSYGNNPAASGVWPPEKASTRTAWPFRGVGACARPRCARWIGSWRCPGLIAARRRSGHPRCA
jgi:hypothetical protein